MVNSTKYGTKVNHEKRTEATVFSGKKKHTESHFYRVSVKVHILLDPSNSSYATMLRFLAIQPKGTVFLCSSTEAI